MVYCTRCGAKNPDDAKVCSECGAPLYPAGGERERFSRRREEECFGIPRGPPFGLVIGIIIALWGLIWFLQQAKIIPPTVEVWPFAAIIFGMLIIISALYGTRR